MTCTIPEHRLHLAPIGLRAANDFVDRHHRHHPSVRGHKFSVSVVDEHDVVRGVAIAGRPRARALDDGQHLEILRVCTDGVPNGCSMLYGAVRRAASALGYDATKVLTYTLADEPGTSLRAAGWRFDHTTQGDNWDTPARPRATVAPPGPKNRWRAA